MPGLGSRLGTVHVDLPEQGHLVSKLAEPHAQQQAVESMVALHLLLEGYFGAGKKAHCHIRFSDGRETPREKVELRRH